MAATPSLKSVAAAAGVSPASVSNAYNRPEQLSAVVRQRILDIAAELGYPGPHPSASSLRSRRTGSIGVLFAQGLTYAFDDAYCTTLLRGVAEAATDAECNLLLMPVGHPPTSTATGASSRDDELRLLHGVRRAALDGAIADGVDSTHPALRVLAERGVPVVRTTDDTDARCVVIDDRAAAVQLGDHLRGLGHRRVLVLAETVQGGDPVLGPDHASLLPYARERIDGFRAAFGSDAVTVMVAGANTRAAGRRAAESVLALDSRATAVAATTDTVALGVLEHLRARGITPGTDLSVTGFDDVPAAESAGLTTVRQPIAEKGRILARMLLDPASTQTRVELATRVVVRASTAPPPTQGEPCQHR